MATHDQEPTQEMTFFEHLDALRPHLVRGGIVMLVFLIVAFLAKGFVIDTVLFGPQSADFPTNRLLARLAGLTGIDALRINQLDLNMINTSMAGQFNLHLRISLITAIVLATPYILWELWQFIKPALTPRERRGSSRFVGYVSLCFFTGLLFGYYVIVPLSVNFLSGYTASSQITNLIDVNSYLSTVVNVSIAAAIVFELPLLIYFLARMGIVKAAFLRRYRRHAIVALAIFSAIITPPDVFSQIMVLLPLYALYEYSISLAAGVERKAALHREAEEAAFRALPDRQPDGTGDDPDSTPPGGSRSGTGQAAPTPPDSAGPPAPQDTEADDTQRRTTATGSTAEDTGSVGQHTTASSAEAGAAGNSANRAADDAVSAGNAPAESDTPESNAANDDYDYRKDYGRNEN